MNQNQQKFAETEAFFRCPSCGGEMHVENGSFLCANRHCYDISAKGYVNFLTGQPGHRTKYSKELFESRSRILQAGFYDAVLDKIKEIAGSSLEKGGSILDAGCGEGFYAKALSKEFLVFALDNAKEAVQMAARGGGDVRWTVADLAHVPLGSQSMDMVLNLLTPANYTEFNRILKPDGIMLKVIPGKDYLRQIRESVSDQLVKKDHSSENTIALFQENMALIEQSEIHYTLPVDKASGEDFFQMTPMTFHVDIERIHKIDSITIDLIFLLGRKK